MIWSIVVCTYNRASDLRANLPKLLQLDYPHDSYEIIIIDNGSTDDTANIVEEAASRDSHISFVREDKIGLSFARNRGIKAAHGDFIAFIDDDAWPEPEWLKKLEEMFADPRVMCAGGKTVPVFRNLSGWPNWLFRGHYCFFTFIDHETVRKLHYAAYPVGTNIAFRISVFSEVGYFNPELGRIGDSLLSMEEMEFCLRIEKAGFDILYTPDAVVHHRVHEERLTREWVEKRAYWEGISAALLEKKQFTKMKLLLKYIKYCAFILGGITGDVIFRITNNDKMSFFCRCQTILCQAYLNKSWSLLKKEMIS